MDGEGDEHHGGISRILVGEREFRVKPGEMSVAEILALAGKSPEEWALEADLPGGDRVALGNDDPVTLREGGFVQFHLRRREHHSHHHEDCALTVVVNSVPVKSGVRRSTLLQAVVTETLAKAAQTGRAEDQWELKTEAGVVLDLALTVEQASVECGSVLYLSLKAGAAGDAAGELLVDPAVSLAKFDEQIAAFRNIEDSHARRGIWLVKAEFPEAFLVFGAPNSGPLYQLAFGALIDFSNYDLWAPSVRVVNPITRLPYKAGELPLQAQLLRQTRGKPATPGEPPPAELGRFMQWHTLEELPFLCHPGVREYHLHPAHTGDDWLLHRGRGEGTLSRVVELLFQYGSSKVVGLQVQVMPALSTPSQ